MKIYKTEKSLKAAVKREGLDRMNWRPCYTMGRETGHYGHFYCAEREDVAELRSRGFSAEFAPEKAAK